MTQPGLSRTCLQDAAYFAKWVVCPTGACRRQSALLTPSSAPLELVALTCRALRRSTMRWASPTLLSLQCCSVSYGMEAVAFLASCTSTVRPALQIKWLLQL